MLLVSPWDHQSEAATKGKVPGLRLLVSTRLLRVKAATKGKGGVPPTPLAYPWGSSVRRSASSGGVDMKR